jgi:hypothetical protein
MDEQDLRRAFQAWTLAVTEFLQGKPFPCEDSIRDLANQYGQMVTNPEALEAASRFFDWDAIETHLRNRPR